MLGFRVGLLALLVGGYEEAMRARVGVVIAPRPETHRSRRCRGSMPAIGVNQCRDPVANLVAYPTDLSYRFALGVLEWPIVAFEPRNVRALVAAPHRHQEERAGCELLGQLLRPPCRHVDADLAHDVDDLWMHAVPGLGAGRHRFHFCWIRK